MAQPVNDHLQHLGLIGELSYHKNMAENHALRIFNHRDIPDSVKSEMITRYEALRNAYEELLLQLISDIHTRNRWFYIKNLDKYFYRGKIKNRRMVKYFIENWKQVLVAYDNVMTYPGKEYDGVLRAEYRDLGSDEVMLTESKQEALSGMKLNPLDPVGSAGSVFSIYKKINLKNDMKVGNTTIMLNSVRLRHAAELVPDEKEKMEVNVDNSGGGGGK